MLKKDYILRQFEEFGKVMAVILGYKKKNEWQKFEAQIQEALLKFCSIEINEVENLTSKEFENKILQHPTLHFDQFKILADLLYEKMEYYEITQNAEKTAGVKQKCLALYEKLSSELTQNEFNLDIHYKISRLKKH